MADKTGPKAWGATAGGAGAALLSTATAACCIPVVAPVLVSVLGVGGAVWAAGLRPYSPYVLAASGVLLAYAFRAVYRRRPPSSGASCPTGRPRAVRIVLWASGLLWLLALGLHLLLLIPSPGS